MVIEANVRMGLVKLSGKHKERIDITSIPSLGYSKYNDKLQYKGLSMQRYTPHLVGFPA